MRVLAVNAGSSSLKLALLHTGADEPEWSIEVDAGALAQTVGSLEGIGAAGHRIVHGGERFREPVLIGDEVRAALDELADLAPLHQPKSLTALDAVSRLLPDVPAVACFDTAFHATLPAAAATYALPAAWRERWGIRRYGFHGLSHAWIARRVPELLGRSAAGLRIVSCHLGAGASLCAIRDGRSVDTTMGFTPLEGLVMATRSGSVDPGLLLWLLERTGLTERDLAEALEHESGLLGLAGTADLREVLERAAAGEASAALAREVYLHRLRCEVAAMSASMGGLDVLVFTGGVGENSGEVRERTVSDLGFLLDGAEVLVVPAREDVEIARQVDQVLRAGGSTPGRPEPAPR